MTRTKQRTRAVGYVRISKETDDTLSPTTQRKRIRDLVTSRGWDLVDMVEDIDESAYDGRRRPGLEAVLGRLDEFDALVFARLDRLTRTPSESLAIAERTRAASVELVSCDAGEIDTSSAEGEFQFGLLVGLYRREVRVLSERIKGGVRTAREQGHHLGRVPFGWTTKDKQLVPDPAAQRVLRDAARRYVAGESWGAIAKRYGMNRGPLRRMLDSERVLDLLSPKLRADLETAMAARAPDRSPTSKMSLLGGIARCVHHDCGLGRGGTTGRDGTRYHQYRCPTCGLGISAPWLDDYVGRRVVDEVDTGRLAAAIRKRRKVGSGTGKVAEIEARISMLDERYAAGKVSEDRFDRMNAALVDGLAAAKAETRRNGGPDLPLELAHDLANRWDTLDVQARRRIISAVVERIDVRKTGNHGPTTEDRVRIAWR